MKTLKSILGNYSEISHDLGERKAELQKKKDYSKMKQELLAVKKSKSSWIKLCTVLLVVIYAIDLFIFIFYIKEIEIIKIAISVSGLLLPCLMAYLRKLWLEREKIDLILILALNLKNEYIDPIVNTLVSQLKD
ncbi:MAG: hypothetical protein NT007_16100 [Candidatus Kapabacteria bacterium]|nr:hypothetical protein [Candidatus Kapabacteria bacterium]